MAPAAPAADRAYPPPSSTRSNRPYWPAPAPHGYDTDLWTLARVAQVIGQVTGVTHHPGHVWRLLRRLDWTPQRPARRATERNDEQIARWIAEDWP